MSRNKNFLNYSAGQSDGKLGAGWGGDAYAIPASEASPESRADFIRKTYMHLIGALCALFGIELLIFNLVPENTLQSAITWAVSGWTWILVIVAFMAVSWLARSWAESGASKAMQYAGLGVYIVAQALIFVPLLYIASRFSSPDVIPTAAIVTGLMVVALTAFVFVTKADFSFLRGFLFVGGLGAVGLIVASVAFGFSLGIFFTVAMIVLLCGYILYDTSNVMHHYPVGAHVAASLALFASISTLFFYVLRLLMYLNQE